MIIQQINCNAGHRYFVRVKVPDGADLVAPTEPVTGILARFTETPGGDAIDDALDELEPDASDDDPALMVLDVSQGLHQTHLLPLGRGTKYYVVYSKAGVGDFYVDSFAVAAISNI